MSNRSILIIIVAFIISGLIGFFAGNWFTDLMIEYVNSYELDPNIKSEPISDFGMLLFRGKIISYVFVYVVLLIVLPLYLFFKKGNVERVVKVILLIELIGLILTYFLSPVIILKVLLFVFWQLIILVNLLVIKAKK